MSNIIRRDYYLQKLIDRKENGLVKSHNRDTAVREKFPAVQLVL